MISLKRESPACLSPQGPREDTRWDVLKNVICVPCRYGGQWDWGCNSDPSNLTPRMAGRLIHCGGLRGVPALGQAHDSQCCLRTREDMCPVGQGCGRVRENWGLRSYLRGWPRGPERLPQGKSWGRVLDA